MSEELEPQITYYWATCRTEGCRVNGVYGEGVPCVAHPETNEVTIFCWACSQPITDIGPMDPQPTP